MKHITIALMFALWLGASSAQASYNPSQGRWLSRDPIEEKGGKNLYVFCRNQANGRFDRNGLDDASGEIVVLTPKPSPGDKAEQEAAEALAKWMERGIGIGFTVDSIQDANTKLRSCNTCIKELHIQGHGAPGYQNIGSEQSSLADFPDKDRSMSSKGIGVPDFLLPTYNGSVGFGLFKDVNFCKPCTIVLRGCNVGYGQAGANLMERIYEKTGCKVRAFRGTTTAGTDDGLSGSHGPMDWLIGHDPSAEYPVADGFPEQPSDWYNY